jgi:hypothetical protein
MEGTTTRSGQIPLSVSSPAVVPGQPDGAVIMASRLARRGDFRHALVSGLSWAGLTNMAGCVVMELELELELELEGW